MLEVNSELSVRFDKKTKVKYSIGNRALDSLLCLTHATD
jgi:hypothetical protein